MALWLESALAMAPLVVALALFVYLALVVAFGLLASKRLSESPTPKRGGVIVAKRRLSTVFRGTLSIAADAASIVSLVPPHGALAVRGKN